MSDYYLNVTFGNSSKTTDQFVDLLIEDQTEFPTESLIIETLKQRGYSKGRIYNLSYMCYATVETT